MLYKYKKHLFIISFLSIFIGLYILFGGAHCGDGWSSHSIGRRGACSHHGGVVSYNGFILVVSLILSFIIYNTVSRRYKVVYEFVVLSDLPPHPGEKVLNKYVKMEILDVNEKSKSRVDFLCNNCGLAFKAGEVYYHKSKKQRNKKYCLKCTQDLNELEMLKKQAKIDVYGYYKERSLDTIR